MQAATVTGEWRILNACIMNQNDLRISNGFLVPTCSARVPQQNKGKRLAFQRFGGCRPRNASWGYGRHLGQPGGAPDCGEGLDP